LRTFEELQKALRVGLPVKISQIQSCTSQSSVVPEEISFNFTGGQINNAFHVRAFTFLIN